MLGAILVIAADMLGRSVIPDREVPTGLVTALIGTPYFLWLLSTRSDASPNWRDTPRDAIRRMREADAKRRRKR